MYLGRRPSASRKSAAKVSSKLGQKGIIKLSRVFFKDDEINKIALVAPCAKLNIIKDFDVVEKRVVEIPDEIFSIVKCVNPKCITNNEKVSTRFEVISKSEVKLKCHYCEKITDQDNIEIAEELAAAVGGVVSCSRPIVDAKWLEKRSLEI